MKQKDQYGQGGIDRSKIAKTVGISLATVTVYLRELGIELPQPQKPKSEIEIEIERLYN